jgi:hypothetical protein
MRQLMRTVRTLEAEWRQVLGEAWVRGQRKMSQVLGTFGLPYFTMLRPVLAWRAFWNLWIIYLFNFPILLSGRGELGILNQRLRGHAYTLHHQSAANNTCVFGLITNAMHRQRTRSPLQSPNTLSKVVLPALQYAQKDKSSHQSRVSWAGKRPSELNHQVYSAHIMEIITLSVTLTVNHYQL